MKELQLLTKVIYELSKVTGESIPESTITVLRVIPDETVKLALRQAESLIITLKAKVN